jgi:hypothetical protein
MPEPSTIPDVTENQKQKENRAAGEEGLANLGSTGSGIAKELQKGIGGDMGYQPPPPVPMPKD